MDSQSIKLSLIQWLLQLDDKTLLKVDTIRKSTASDEYAHKPMTKKELETRALASEEDIANGRIISIEDLEKEIKTW
jgi:hypothetical protein